MATATADGLRGLEGIILGASSSTTSESSDSPSLMSRVFSYAPYALGAYYTYQRAREWMEYMNSDSNPGVGENGKQPWYQGAAIDGLKVLVLGLAAAGAYSRVQAAHEYYSTEVNNFDMQESHLSGLAYALTYGEQPTSDFDYKNGGRLYNIMYKTLKTLQVDRLDNTEIGSYLILNALGMGSQVAEEVGGGVGDVARKMGAKRKKKTTN